MRSRRQTLNLRQGSFSFHGLKLVYYDNGLAGEPFLLTHANGYCAMAYQFYIQKLTERGVRVVALDFAGHGLSEGTLKFRNWNFYRDQVLALVEHLSLQNIVGLGHSMGGAALMRAAALNPRKFRAIIALDPTLLFWMALIFMVFFRAPLAKAAGARRSYFPSREVLERFLRRTMPYRNFSPEALRGYLQFGFQAVGTGYRLSCSSELEAKNYMTVGTFSLCQYKRLETPVHFILPQKSEVCPLRRAQKIAQKIPGSTVVSHQDFEHLFPFTHPKECWELITTRPGVLLPPPRLKRSNPSLSMKTSPQKSQRVG
ncbi:MAG: alpha/beta hydrolase [Leptospiraceae bacterium]|nr:alpha/beta hydrolase [Leptospiraceae bacterium]